jgi:CHASE2 domain-containing sensor protein
MEKIKEFIKNKTFVQNLLYTIYIIFTMSILFVFFTTPYIRDFFTYMENKSFDVRQNLIASYKKVDKNIVIVSVDERSYEYLLEKYGEWPISRNIYADIIKYLEK